VRPPAGRQATREDLESIARRLLVLVGSGMPEGVDRALKRAPVDVLRRHIHTALGALELRACGAQRVASAGAVLTRAPGREEGGAAAGVLFLLVSVAISLALLWSCWLGGRS
jgi:hypothetical protein